MQSAHIDDFFAFLRFPSISAQPAHSKDMRNCAEWLSTKLRNIGFSASLCDTLGHPIVLARLDAATPNSPTLLIYGHYDVQPVDPLELWESQPFEPTVKDGFVFARGATDNKGQILSHILGVQEWIEKRDALPVNIIFLIEGEEEVGSPNLAPFLREHRAELACDAIVVSDTGMVDIGCPTLTYGLRGIAAMEIHLSGPAMDLHSGIYGGAVANPVTELCRLVASLHDQQGRVAVEGFYNGVRPLQDWERSSWAGLPFNEEKIASVTKVPTLWGETGYSALERIWSRPTAEVNGIYGGYQGDGSKTVLPAQACAKLTFRLVPDQEPEKIQECVRKHFERICPPSVSMRIEMGHTGMPYLMEPDGTLGKLAIAALKKAFPSKEPALVREGGSVPIVADFKTILGAETLLLGLALPGCQIHSPNENFSLENLYNGIAINQAIIEEMKTMPKKS